jgi:hypothetical protein
MAAKLVREGLHARFEPTMDRANAKQPDLKLDNPPTGESVFLELARLGPQDSEREATEANSAIIAALSAISIDLCYSVLWHRPPSDRRLTDILERIKAGAIRALNERTIVFVEDETLEMAVCHKDVTAALLDPWSKEQGLAPGLLLGPTLNFKDTSRLKWKIGHEQVQLPRDKAGVIVILATDAFLRAGGVARVISEVEDDVFKHDHVHLVIVHGEHSDPRELPFAGYQGEHQYTRRILDGNVENELMLVNHRARMKLSDDLLAKFRGLF